MLSAIFAFLFGLSLLPGRKPACLRFAERISGGILPDGAAEYCRRLTWVWFWILLSLSAVNIVSFAASRIFAAWPHYLGYITLAIPAVVVPMTFLVEGRIRRKRFSVTFHTSGSTGKSKTIVKTFESLAKEVAFHCDFYRGRISADDTVFLCTIEPGHMYGTLWRTMLPKALGCRVDPEVIMTPESLLAKMKNARSVFLVTTPSFLSRFTSYASGYDVPRNCVEITTSGALLTSDVASKTERVFGLAPREIFGSTETGGVASRRQSADALAKGDVPWEVFPPVRVSAFRDGVSAAPRLEVRSPFSFAPRYVMGDGVELAADGRSFRLLGRMDRMVKINEERVNLAEMEEKVRALGFDECALAVVEGRRGPCIGCVVVRKDGEGPDALELRRMMLPVFPKGTVPKKFRYVRSLPRNAQGKVVMQTVKEILDSALVEPKVLSESQTEGCYEAKLVFDANAPYFDGHFPGMPILPGVAQVGFAVRYSRLAGSSGALKCVKRMKFTKIISPGAEIGFSVRRRGEGEFAYEYREGEATCSSGLLQF